VFVTWKDIMGLDGIGACCHSEARAFRLLPQGEIYRESRAGAGEVIKILARLSGRVLFTARPAAHYSQHSGAT
jgi:hypothetical protein